MSVTAANKTVPADVIEKFRAIDVDCISDAVRGLRLNCFDVTMKPLVSTWKICGPALTARLIPLQDSSVWYKHEHHPATLMDIAKPGDVVVIDQGGRLDVALWGGNTATRAKKIGLGGVVIDGACRDGATVVAMNVPTFVKGTTPAHGHGVFGTTCYMSEPVQIGSMSVFPGDLMIGDSDGIVVIPVDRASEILEAAQLRHEIDEKTGRALNMDAKERMHAMHRIYGIPPRPEDAG
jgi:4-hydroxy-4-methyl-2-oxoglutarate aldolase